MAATVKALVFQASTTTGTGNFTLTTIAGWRSMDDVVGHGATQNTIYYYIRHQTASEWELGTGHMSDATTLVRDTVIASSNSNNAVNFSAGNKDVSCDFVEPSATIIAFLAAATAAAARTAIGAVAQVTMTAITTGTTTPAAGADVIYECDPSGGAITIDLANSPNSVELHLKQGVTVSSTNYVEIKPPSGKKIYEQTANDTVSIENQFDLVKVALNASGNYN